MCFGQHGRATNSEDELIGSCHQPSTKVQTLGVDEFYDSDLKECSWQDGPARRADFPEARSPQKEAILIHAMLRRAEFLPVR